MLHEGCLRYGVVDFGSNFTNLLACLLKQKPKLLLPSVAHDLTQPVNTTEQLLFNVCLVWYLFLALSSDAIALLITLYLL